MGDRIHVAPDRDKHDIVVPHAHWDCCTSRMWSNFLQTTADRCANDARRKTIAARNGGWTSGPFSRKIIKTNKPGELPLEKPPRPDTSLNETSAFRLKHNRKALMH